MAIIFLIGRLIVGFYFLESAYNHLVKGGGMLGYAASKGLKSPKLAVYGSGVLLLIGGLSVLLGAWPHIGLIALLLFLIPVTWKMHNYWKETDPMMKMNQRIQFMKNLALIGFVLMAFQLALPWAYHLI